MALVILAVLGTVCVALIGYWYTVWCRRYEAKAEAERDKDWIADQW
jgi:hypothetical protein